MGRMTGGRISFCETRQMAQYEPRKAEVELAFTLDEDDDYEKILAGVQAECIARVHNMLGLKPAPVAEEKPAEAKKRGPGRPPKPVKAVEPTEEVEETSEVEEDLSDILGDDEPTEAKSITDADLQKTISASPLAKKSEDNAGPKKIKALIQKFAGEGKKSTSIPMDKRPAFIAELEKLAA